MEQVKHGYEENRRILIEGLPGAGLDTSCPPTAAFISTADVSKFTDDSLPSPGRSRGGANVAATSGIDFDPIPWPLVCTVLLWHARPPTCASVQRITRWLKRWKPSGLRRRCPKRGRCLTRRVGSLHRHRRGQRRGIEKLPSSYIRRAPGIRGSSERQVEAGAVLKAPGIIGEKLFRRGLCLFAPAASGLDRMSSLAPPSRLKSSLIGEWQQGRRTQLSSASR